MVKANQSKATDREMAWMTRGILPKLRDALAEVRRVPLRADTHEAWCRVDERIRFAISTGEQLSKLAEYFLSRREEDERLGDAKIKRSEKNEAEGRSLGGCQGRGSEGLHRDAD